MNLLEQELHYPLGDALPAPGQRMKVAEGVYWHRMALPFALDHINLWLLKDRIDGVDGWTVVDCCLDNPQARAQWQAVFDQCLEGLPVLRVLATHMHPDHLGLAHWLCAHWQVPLWISATDYQTAKNLIASTSTHDSQQAIAFFMSHGLSDPTVLAALKDRSLQFGHMVPALPSQFVRLHDGLTVQIGGHPWHCISGYGHAPEHIALHCPALNVLIAGDMVLPRISSNISVYDIEPESNPLQMFLDSLSQYAHLPADCLVLPSHGKPFTGLHQRITQLRHHHAERLEDLTTACTDEGLSAAQALQILFKRAMDAHQMTFALGESLAHLHLLWHAGDFQRWRGEDGIYRFKPSEARPRP
jgi:glyoxylase-like metal-dependent hydrolase (beta-lactamase superfamily II)